MVGKDPKLIVLQFNECINNRDIDGLSSLMAEDNVFIDSSNKVHSGKGLNINSWLDFFDQFPDYFNHFLVIESRGDLVLVTDYSTCSYKPLDGQVIWTAKVENDLVVEWRVYLDTAKNRKELNFQI